jgi:butyrate kinase
MALFRGMEKIADETVSHPAEQLAAYNNVADQFELRMKNINDWLDRNKIGEKKVVAVAGRGAPLRPLDGSIYWIGEKMLTDIRQMKYSNHASNLGAIIAEHLGKKYNVPAIIVDPVTVDNFSDFARISGTPEIERKSRAHVLNIKEICRRDAIRRGRKLENCDYVAVHMGGGISVVAVKNGKIIDANDALLGMGPFSPDRAGALPISGLVKLAFSGKYTERELLEKLSRKAGLLAYIGQNDLREVEKMIEGGDKKAELYFGAMVYQIAKEIGAMAVVLGGKFDGIILTGGMAKSARLVELLKSYISFLGDVIVVPGEFELEALAAGAMRVLEKKETPQDY